MATERCDCGGSLDRGFLFTTNEGVNMPVSWVEGEVDRSRLTGNVKVKKRTRLPVVALRCQNCGALDLGAPAQ
jgi:hypothetical protein